MKYKSFAVAIWGVVILLVILVPLPTVLMDILFILNITISLLVLLNAIYAKDALSMSSFPTLLLFTTLYRLALNVAATRLIIGQGDAGKVVESFGEFVGGNNIVVGAIIFLVIMLVQFLVITKGAERVSEVAARFTLDAMPGKQMAVDADLNAGLINEAQAKERRKNIQREADFYGAMDGASKFVKNDAIFGFITVILNIIGGFIMGMMQNSGASWNDILEKYTKLTIGNGLAVQIPALLISVATGIIVTRAASDEELSEEIISQLFTGPKTMFVAAGACFLLTFIIGRFFMIIVAAFLVFLGIRMQDSEQEKIKQDEKEMEERTVEEIRKPENVVTLLHVDPIELEFGYGLIPLADVNQGGDLLDRVVMIRRQLALELGMIVPVIRLRDNIQLNPNQYVIKIKGVEVAEGELLLDHFLAMNPGTAEEEIEGIPTTEPAFGLPALWITESQRDRAEMLGYTVVDPPSVISTHMTEVIKRHAHELLSRQDVQTLLDNVKSSYPAIVEELVPKQLSLGEVQKVLCNLLREGVSIRDMVTILETLADYAPVTRDTDMLTEYVRQALGRAITKTFITPDNSDVITLDPQVEQLILDSVQKTEAGSYIALEPSVSNKIMQNLLKLVEKVAQLGKQPIVLASPVVRLYFKRLTEQTIPGLVVLSYNELDPSVKVRSIGMVTCS
ncbi:flagellar biosynthesis protein FlhA [Thermoclostridium stercorarium subsp. stercorarium DSM 8532]|jgi:flagellar biosynthesis protein FlhA|uniref:Flagellar biosynthesis protein FlhA n=3 Tax=Thermoclostridium stercorarium TaxID=1510 RepID=L7VMN5_THES1|nr:flagellar biosynthesis protein FlhA [Thermoclostridium stercorarium]AGC67721.1 flagellar biosynthesis protein FlhA [Thermoclostridium stercorarium subsp. stercorarium DSM 8532]AGI38772.1 FlhA [Thermoclostridium stercorarium subsp. stercorarium DSM 8532]ANW98135.1 EscV/YscV/HrcV family type III secretion system export apparatus protein [Thermoclostridium stercorarium subsp. thermolacticum DSM 2910]ANX00674.1 EscV/YscV/HrcV family type III secretion system export apparatus protein [Thermoclost